MRSNAIIEFHNFIWDVHTDGAACFLPPKKVHRPYLLVTYDWCRKIQVYRRRKRNWRLGSETLRRTQHGAYSALILKWILFSSFLRLSYVSISCQWDSGGDDGGSSSSRSSSSSSSSGSSSSSSSNGSYCVVVIFKGTVCVWRWIITAKWITVCRAQPLNHLEQAAPASTHR